MSSETCLQCDQNWWWESSVYGKSGMSSKGWRNELCGGRSVVWRQWEKNEMTRTWEKKVGAMSLRGTTERSLYTGWTDCYNTWKGGSVGVTGHGWSVKAWISRNSFTLATLYKGIIRIDRYTDKQTAFTVLYKINEWVGGWLECARMKCKGISKWKLLLWPLPWRSSK